MDTTLVSLAHGSFFMLGAYLGFSMIERGMWFWAAAIASGIAVCRRMCSNQATSSTAPQASHTK